MLSGFLITYLLLKEWGRFEQAAKLDRRAAIMSISMGAFQIVGMNYKLCGYKSPEEFFEAMQKNEGKQLKAFCNFIKNRGLVDELRRKDFLNFSLIYNGPSARLHYYPERLEAAYKRLKLRQK